MFKALTVWTVSTKDAQLKPAGNDCDDDGDDGNDDDGGDDDDTQ